MRQLIKNKVQIVVFFALPFSTSLVWSGGVPFMLGRYSSKYQTPVIFENYGDKFILLQKDTRDPGNNGYVGTVNKNMYPEMGQDALRKRSSLENIENFLPPLIHLRTSSALHLVRRGLLENKNWPLNWNIGKYLERHMSIDEIMTVLKEHAACTGFSNDIRNINEKIDLGEEYKRLKVRDVLDKIIVNLSIPVVVYATSISGPSQNADDMRWSLYRPSLSKPKL